MSCGLRKLQMIVMITEKKTQFTIFFLYLECKILYLNGFVSLNMYIFILNKVIKLSMRCDDVYVTDGGGSPAGCPPGAPPHCLI